MTSSRVELGTGSDPSLYRGHVTGLSGTDIAAVVTNAGGAQLALTARVALNPDGQTAAGTLTVGPA